MVLIFNIHLAEDVSAALRISSDLMQLAKSSFKQNSGMIHNLFAVERYTLCMGVKANALIVSYFLVPLRQAAESITRHHYKLFPKHIYCLTWVFYTQL